MKHDDPMELYIPINELIYSLKSEIRDYIKALYWTSWIIKYASKFKEE